MDVLCNALASFLMTANVLAVSHRRTPGLVLILKALSNNCIFDADNSL